MQNAKETVNDVITRGTAIGGLIGIAVIHAEEVPGGFDEVWYLGFLFIAAVVATLVLAALFAQTGDLRLLAVAGGLAALLMIGFVLSRTSGLPGFTDEIGVWGDTSGLASLAFEGLVVCLTAGAFATRRYPMTATSATSVEPRANPAPGMS